MPDEPVVILENHKVNEKYFKLAFRSRALSRGASPGQFLNLAIDEPPLVPTFPSIGLVPFLRRPFSYYRVQGDRIEILYEILGIGTAVLAGKKKGDRFRAMGPLGKPFSTEIKKKKRVLVAGGVGVPPLVFLAERFPVDYVLIGCKSKKEVLPKKELVRVKGKISYATDDGSFGTKGFVTGLLEKILKKESPSQLFIQTCGPKVMIQAVLEIARQRDIDGEASVDETMACGVGSCLGCMVKTPEGWTPSCTHGPVFRFNELESIISND